MTGKIRIHGCIEYRTCEIPGQPPKRKRISSFGIEEKKQYFTKIFACLLYFRLLSICLIWKRSYTVISASYSGYKILTITNFIYFLRNPWIISMFLTLSSKRLHDIWPLRWWMIHAKHNLFACDHYRDVKWARWRLKSPASPLFTHPFIQAQIKGTSRLCVTCLCAGNSRAIGEFSAQKARNAEMFPFGDVIMWRESCVAISCPILPLSIVI